MLKQKAQGENIVYKISEQKIKEREEKKSRQVEHTFIPVERAAQRNVKKEDRARFNNAWSIVVVRAANE